MRKKVKDMLDGVSLVKGQAGQQPHDANETNKKKVRRLADLGVPHTIICIAIGIDLKTLHKYYADELDAGKVSVVEALFKTAQQRAKESDAVLIFLMKTIAGLRETEVVDGNGGAPKIIEIRVTGRGERIAKADQSDDDI